MAEAVRYLSKKGQNKAAKTEIKPAVKPELLKRVQTRLNPHQLKNQKRHLKKVKKH